MEHVLEGHRVVFQEELVNAKEMHAIRTSSSEDEIPLREVQSCITMNLVCV